MLGRSRLDFESEPGSIPVGAIVETGTAWGVPMPGSLLFYFCPLIPRIGLLVFLLVSAAIDDENSFKFKWLRNYAVTGQGRQCGEEAMAFKGESSRQEIASAGHRQEAYCDARRGRAITLEALATYRPQASINCRRFFNALPRR
jgi:hypothetical protein